MAGSSWIDATRPSAARIYDYMLGGAHNFKADRLAAAAMLERFPDAARAATPTATSCVESSPAAASGASPNSSTSVPGSPPAGNVHDVARRLRPEARVAYVDIEAVAVAHSPDVFAGDPLVSITQADLRDPLTFWPLQASPGFSTAPAP